MKSEQSSKPLIDLFLNIHDILFLIVTILSLIISISCIKWITKIYKTKEQKFKVNKWSWSFFIISPILLFGFIIGIIIYRVNAFYLIPVYQARFSWKYLLLIIILLIITTSIWIYKSILITQFHEWKVDFKSFAARFKKPKTLEKKLPKRRFFKMKKKILKKKINLKL